MQVLSQFSSLKLATSIDVDVHQHSVTSSGERPVLHARLSSQVTITQSLTGTSVKPLSTSSTADAEVSEREANLPETNADLQLSEEQNYRETED